MSYDFSTQHAQGTPNFPPNYTTGKEDLAWGNDLISDPGEDGEADVTDGWTKGLGIGSQT